MIQYAWNIGSNYEEVVVGWAGAAEAVADVADDPEAWSLARVSGEADERKIEFSNSS